jgi:hypothetical protein
MKNNSPDAGSNKFKIWRTIYWIITIIIAIVFFITGVGNLVPFEHIAQDMLHLGYPTYFRIILGSWKILGAVTILFPGIPRLKEWAYAGMVFDLTGAMFSRLATGSGVMLAIIPMAIAGLVLISWALRPKFTYIPRIP